MHKVRETYSKFVFYSHLDFLLVFHIEKLLKYFQVIYSNFVYFNFIFDWSKLEYVSWTLCKFYFQLWTCKYNVFNLIWPNFAKVHEQILIFLKFSWNSATKLELKVKFGISNLDFCQKLKIFSNFRELSISENNIFANIRLI